MLKCHLKPFPEAQEDLQNIVVNCMCWGLPLLCYTAGVCLGHEDDSVLHKYISAKRNV